MNHIVVVHIIADDDLLTHYSDVMMGAMTSHNTSLTIV